MRAAMVVGGLLVWVGCQPAPSRPGEDGPSPIPELALDAGLPDGGGLDGGGLDGGPSSDAGGPADQEPPLCPRAPCADRPVVFVHGIVGSNDDFAALLAGLLAKDGRFDRFHLAGNADHAAWGSRSLGRREWLFAFDYYNERKEDARGAYTSGPGRIGSNAARRCEQPAGQGNLLATHPDYDQGVRHEYAADLARFVDSVLRATGAQQVDLVGHSMGGLISRSYVAYHGGSRRVRSLVLLASPVHGVPLIGVVNYLGVGLPPWMANHEAAELDGNRTLRKISFRRCGLPDEEPLLFGSALLRDEEELPPGLDRFVLTGERDVLIRADLARHPLARSHEVVPGADHNGILRSELTLERVRAFTGGTHAPR